MKSISRCQTLVVITFTENAGVVCLSFNLRLFLNPLQTTGPLGRCRNSSLLLRWCYLGNLFRYLCQRIVWLVQNPLQPGVQERRRSANGKQTDGRILFIRDPAVMQAVQRPIRSTFTASYLGCEKEKQTSKQTKKNSSACRKLDKQEVDVQWRTSSRSSYGALINDCMAN